MEIGQNISIDEMHNHSSKHMEKLINFPTKEMDNKEKEFMRKKLEEDL